MNQADIIINGYRLTPAQASTIHVALCSLDSDLNDSGLGDDAHGLKMTENYKENISYLRELMAIK